MTRATIRADIQASFRKFPQSVYSTNPAAVKLSALSDGRMALTCLLEFESISPSERRTGRGPCKMVLRKSGASWLIESLQFTGKVQSP